MTYPCNWRACARACASSGAATIHSGWRLQWSYERVVLAGQPSQNGTEGLAACESSSLGKRCTAQCGACPANIPAPATSSAYASAYCTNGRRGNALSDTRAVAGVDRQDCDRVAQGRLLGLGLRVRRARCAVVALRLPVRYTQGGSNAYTIARARTWDAMSAPEEMPESENLPVRKGTADIDRSIHREKQLLKFSLATSRKPSRRFEPGGGLGGAQARQTGRRDGAACVPPHHGGGHGGAQEHGRHLQACCYFFRRGRLVLYS